MWLQYPLVGNAPGAAPDGQIQDIPELYRRLRQCAEDPSGLSRLDVDEDIAGARQGVLAEAVFLLHKSANALAGGQIHIEAGLRSWSISSSYKAAFLAAKGIQRLLGVATLESGRRSFVVDVWAHNEKRWTKQPKTAKERRIRLIRVKPLGHRGVWVMFRRVLRVLRGTEDIWPATCLDAIRNVEAETFAAARNKLHYNNAHWPFEDMHELLPRDGFGDLGCLVSNGTAISPDREDFPLALSFALVGFAAALLADLAQYSGSVRQESELLQAWLGSRCNSLYNATLKSQDRGNS